MLRKQTSKQMNEHARIWTKNAFSCVVDPHVAEKFECLDWVCESDVHELWRQKCGGDQMERFMGARMSLNVTLLCSKVLPSLNELERKPHVMVVGVEASEESRARDNWNWFIGLKHKTRFDSILIQIDWLIRMKWIHYRVALVQDCIFLMWDSIGLLHNVLSVEWKKNHESSIWILALNFNSFVFDIWNVFDHLQLCIELLPFRIQVAYQRFPRPS